MAEKIIGKKRKTVFELEVCRISNKYSAKQHAFLPTSYPFNLSRYSRAGFFSSLQKAEAAIQKCIKDDEKRVEHDIYCFYVTEYLTDRTVWSHQQTCRSYLPDGTLQESCLTSAYGSASAVRRPAFRDLADKTADELRHIGIYPGRRPEEIRFKKGDIVEVVAYDRVFLGVLADTPWTDEYVKERAIISGSYSLDVTDDCYLVYKCIRSKKEAHHSHPQCTDVFSPRFPIPEKLKEGLQAVQRTLNGEDCGYQLY